MPLVCAGGRLKFRTDRRNRKSSRDTRYIFFSSLRNSWGIRVQESFSAVCTADAAWNETVQPRVQDFSPKECEVKALGTKLEAVACDKLCVFTWRHGGHIHSILLNILQQDFGVVGTVLNWFDSFLSGLKQRILVGDKTSDDFNLNCGVPQGGCMGPILFTLYVSRLFNITLFYPFGN